MIRRRKKKITLKFGDAVNWIYKTVLVAMTVMLFSHLCVLCRTLSIYIWVMCDYLRAYSPEQLVPQITTTFRGIV